ncbi:PepSY domain-containing protein [Methylocystis sp. H62]|uniref:PepSY domain-containing protein n=1 Tax=Methylocystis sp. H62 TaxID=2785789 RepID=UPI0018C2ECE3|nr:PepSY domain-containing protein [Methylocystis sp. H62]MBG0792050.1 PepSY domain-containing protein [Methylocystis sp. H62]
MRNLLLASSAFFLLFIAPARADRPLSEEERMKIQSVMTAQGCTGEKMGFDDGGYKVDDARCSDDKIYDLKFDAGFSLIEKVLKR